MILVSYDISDNKVRSKFSKYLSKFGVRLQYSVYKFENSERIVNSILAELNNNFGKQFCESDSVYIFKIDAKNELIKYGYAVHEDEDIMIVE